MATFDGTSTYLRNTAPPVTAYPFTVGFWAICRDSSTDRVAWCLTPTTATSYELSVTSTGFWTLWAGNNQILGPAVVLNAWTFVIGRFISATSRALHVLNPNGTVSDATSTTNSSITPTQMQIGAFFDTAASQFWSGAIAEIWYTNSNIYPSSASSLGNLIYQLAYKGPFSINSIAKDIVEYHSLRAGGGSDRDVYGEVYWGRAGRQTWVNNGGVTAGPHPPLAPDYIRPADFYQRVPV